jgi:methionyl-tRNA formyltransferase
MNITLVCSDAKHPVNAYLKQWSTMHQSDHQISLIARVADAVGGDLLLLVSCTEIVGELVRSRFRWTLVLHASDLPEGRGWSPHIWQILEGRQSLTVSLLEAEDKVDSGKIWKQVSFAVPAGALYDEINDQLFRAELTLLDFAVANAERVQPTEQDPNRAPTYYPRRKPTDSRIDPQRSIESQFNTLRVCDPDRFPAFFELHGCKYKVVLEKLNDT